MVDSQVGRSVVFLMGPTGAGKTALALELVERLPLEIISVDSAMVYRHMDIGTGKPDADMMARAEHRLIDIREPETTYSAAEFTHDAGVEVEKIFATGRIPFLVGGTGLYFRALWRGLATMPQANCVIRERLTAEGESEGWKRLHARLARVDPVSAVRIHPNDLQRIQRALEVFEITGEPMSDLIQRGTHTGLSASINALAISPADRSQLHHTIARRFDGMLSLGLVDEVEALRSRPALHRNLSSMRAVGYRQVWSYLEGESSWQEMCEATLAATRQLAKRQLTWLRNGAGFVWMDAGHAGLSTSACTFVENKFAYWLRDFS